jgi:hypothetical protein
MLNLRLLGDIASDTYTFCSHCVYVFFGGVKINGGEIIYHEACPFSPER